MMKLVLATENQHKVAELKKLLLNTSWEVLSLQDFPGLSQERSGAYSLPLRHGEGLPPHFLPFPEGLHPLLPEVILPQISHHRFAQKPHQGRSRLRGRPGPVGGKPHLRRI